MKEWMLQTSEPSGILVGLLFFFATLGALAVTFISPAPWISLDSALGERQLGPGTFELRQLSVVTATPLAR